MFGFNGKHQGHIIIEANGEAASGVRRFLVGIGSNLGHKATAFLLFDIDNDSGVKAAQVNRSGVLGFETYGQETSEEVAIAWSPASVSGSHLFTFATHFYDIGIGYHKGWIYASAGVLTPATRRNKYAFTNPNLIEWLSIRAISNNQAKTAASNPATGTLTIDGNQFENLKVLELIESYVDTLELKVDLLKRLETFIVSEYVVLSSVSGRLPASLKNITIGQTALTSVNDLISECVLCESLLFGFYSPSPGLANILSTLTGTLDISHMSALKELALSNNPSLTEILMPTVPANQWRIFQVFVPTVAFASIPNADLDNVLESSALVYFEIRNCNKVWAKNFTNAEFSDNLVGFNVYDNVITGDITITDPKVLLKQFILGANTSETNRFENIDLSGLNGGALTTLQIQGVECEDLQLPAGLPSLTQFIAYDNKLDISTNSDLITKINAYAELISLELGNNSVANTEASHIGQDSTNGLGASGDLSSLVDMTVLAINKCKITGTWTLPNVNKLVSLNVAFNPGLDGLTNFAAHININTLSWAGTDLDLDLSTLINPRRIVCDLNTAQTEIDLTGKTTTQTLLAIICQENPLLTTFKFPTSSANAVFGGNISINSNPSLTAVDNIEEIGGMTFRTFDMFGNAALNIPVPIGEGAFTPQSIRLDGNAMNSTNVDLTIMSLHTNRAKTFGSPRSLNISGGTNAAPTGTYQAPAVAGSPANANEAVHELVNVNGWTITTN